MNRKVPPDPDKLLAWMRGVDDQLAALNSGRAFAGRVSFGSDIQVGDVLITTTATTVTFTNVKTGASNTLTLT